jgi:putative transposase
LTGLKKNYGSLSHDERKTLIEKTNSTISITRQAELLNISRSNIYYVPRISKEDIQAMHALDALYTKHPFYGSRRMRRALKDDHQISICRDHVRRLMATMGLEAIYPKKNLSIPTPGAQIYPYLLKNLAIIRPNHVWGTDITYIRLAHGFCYLMAILDWFSRYVVSWELSENMETEFCLTALRSAIHQAIPDIHNSDQGSQFTSNEYTGILTANNIAISMDGRGRCMDNIFTERLWRTVKYEDSYLKHYRSISEAREGLTQYFTFYNTKRRHQSLDAKTPAEVYGTG